MWLCAFIAFCASRVTGALLPQVSPGLHLVNQNESQALPLLGWWGGDVDEKPAIPAGDGRVRCGKACGLCCCGERARGLRAGAPSDWRNEVSSPAAAVARLTVAVGSVTEAARLAWHALPLLLVLRLLRVFKSTRL